MCGCCIYVVFFSWKITTRASGETPHTAVSVCLCEGWTELLTVPACKRLSSTVGLFPTSQNFFFHMMTEKTRPPPQTKKKQQMGSNQWRRPPLFPGSSLPFGPPEAWWVLEGGVRGHARAEHSLPFLATAEAALALLQPAGRHGSQVFLHKL